MNLEPSLWRKARWQLERGWQLGLLGLVVLAGVAAMLWHGYQPETNSGEDVQAMITGFAPEDAPQFGRGIIVTATYQGIYAERDVPLKSLTGCRVGDSIHAARRGAALILYPTPCRH